MLGEMEWNTFRWRCVSVFTKWQEIDVLQQIMMRCDWFSIHLHLKNICIFFNEIDFPIFRNIFVFFSK